MQKIPFKTWVVDKNSALDFDNSLPYFVLAFYHLAEVKNPQEEVASHHAFFQGRDAKGRIYLAPLGINGTLSAPKELACEYLQWLWTKPGFETAEVKIQEYENHAFGKLCVKTREELVALGFDVPLEMRGAHLSPAEWRSMLEEEEDKVVLDIRNDYEWKLGHFEGAIAPPCETFKDFKEYADQLKEKIDPQNTKVLMYCTGGIRCEFFSALLKQNGIENVFQLQGGVIKYGAEEKSKHWKGKLFVFDDRLAVPVSEEETEVIGKCYHCQNPADRYYNCANMDCNELFLCCEACLHTFHGCCQVECSQTSRVRPFKLANTPFRKWYTYAKTKEELNQLRVVEGSHAN